MNREKVIVIAEEAASFEELCAGVRSLGAEPLALYVGNAEGAEQVASFGAHVIGFEVQNLRYEDYVDAFADPFLVLMKSNKRTQCVAGRLAIKLNASVINDVSAFENDGQEVIYSHLAFGGAAQRKEKARGMVIALVGSGVFEPSIASTPGSVEWSSLSVQAGAIRVLEVKEKQEEVVDLDSAKRVVCVGRGIGLQENISQLKSYADRIDAEMACTRPIAEGENWMARSRYLGVSGAVVKPDLYLGFGISGQIQHTVGLSESKVIAVVNKDKNAPFFKNCDVGLVADIEKVLPYLV